MTLETFFEKFNQFADAPDAVEKMRGLILRLAMQGKLSEPHKTDGPVSELLREVEKDKMRLGLESSAKATSGDSGSSDDETADVIPASWTWVRFGNITRHNAGKTLDTGRNRGELRDYITTSNLYWGFFQLDAVRQMPMLDDELERCTAIKGDLLICEGGEAGRAAVWPHDREISFQNHVHRARFFAGINPYFVQRYFEKLNATGEIEKYRKGVGISNMSGKALASIPIPLPPLAEQKRIVAKVDELMALCDRLEAQQQERETRHAALARASLARFSDAPTPANLPFLFHPSYAILPADLRKSILTLAVQGKLVPQDRSDEPAEELLRQISAEQERLMKARLIRRLEITPLTAEEEPFSIPASWAWARLGHIGDWGSGSTPPRGNHELYGGSIAWLKSGELNDNRTLAGSEETVTDLAVKTCSFRLNKLGDVLLAMYGATIGKAAILAEAAVTNQAVCGCTPFTGVLNTYLFDYLLSQRDSFHAASEGGAQPNISKVKIVGYPFPLPPLAEQRRIVAKVEQLMALVDELETQLAASRATAANLLSAIVAELTGTPRNGKASVPSASTTGSRGRPRKS